MKNKWVTFAALAITFAATSHAASVTSRADVSTDFTGFLCDSGPIATPAGCSFSGFTGSFTLQATASASADASGLHAFASESGVSLISSDFIAQTEAIVDFLDGYHFSYAQPFNASLTITTTGAASGGTSYGFTQIDIGSAVAGDECYFFNSGSCTVNALVDPIVSDLLQIRMFLGAEAIDSGLGDYSALANFADTAFISSISFTDLNGNPLELAFTTDSGFTYPMIQSSPVPEPGTAVLFAVGVIGLVTVRRGSGGRAKQSVV
jgi:hypothetical protein